MDKIYLQMILDRNPTRKGLWRELDIFERSEQTWVLLITTLMYPLPRDVRYLLQTYIATIQRRTTVAGPDSGVHQLDL